MVNFLDKFFNLNKEESKDVSFDKSILHKNISIVEKTILKTKKRLKIYKKALNKLLFNKKIKKKYKKEVKHILKFYNENQLKEMINLLEKNLENLKIILSELYKQKELNEVNEMYNLLDIQYETFNIDLYNSCLEIQHQVDLIHAYNELKEN